MSTIGTWGSGRADTPLSGVHQDGEAAGQLTPGTVAWAVPGRAAPQLPCFPVTICSAERGCGLEETDPKVGGPCLSRCPGREV